jgi:hypothetical protein
MIAIAIYLLSKRRSSDHFAKHEDEQAKEKESEGASVVEIQ